MRNVRVMNGLVDLTGEQFGTLKVGELTARRPEPRYRTTCTLCGALSTATHSRLANGAARCLAASHGKVERPRGRDFLSEHRQRLADREAERAVEERELAELRMAADVDPYGQERQEAERKSAEEQKASEENARRKAAEQARKEAKRSFDAKEIQSFPDPQLVLSDAMRSASMAKKDAAAFNVKAAEQLAALPEFAPYRTAENADAITDYLQRNRVFIADFETFRAAFHRLRDLGVLKTKPAPVQKPKRIIPAPPVESSPEPAKPQQTIYDGWDEDGNPRQYTEREVSRWSSEEMKRRLRLYPDKLTLPAVGPGPRGPSAP